MAPSTAGLVARNAIAMESIMRMELAVRISAGDGEAAASCCCSSNSSSGTLTLLIPRPRAAGHTFCNGCYSNAPYLRYGGVLQALL